MSEKMIKIAVIGAGAAGLTATKCLVEANSGFDCTTFELSNSVGGTWVYTDDVGKDQYGLPVHSSMYKGLHTNLPKQIMTLPDLPFKGKSDASYVSAEEVLDYFNEYADHFGLRKYIKFEHHVTMITPIANDQWKINVTDLKRQKESVYYFDAVIICTGNYSNPVYPNLKNRDKFKGLQIHSHDYKHPSRLKGMKVLVIGAGASGLDITLQSSKWATEVYFSHHSEKVQSIEFVDNVTQKPDVHELTENGAVFEDGTEAQLDAIVYCTGYEHKFPYMDPSCKIRVEDGVVKPLYKHFVNIEHPTMFFIGIPRDCPSYSMFHLQTRCSMNILKGESSLPSKTNMHAELVKDLQQKQKLTGKMRSYHRMYQEAEPYYDSLSELGNLPKTRRIFFEIYFTSLDYMMQDFHNFRKRTYQIVDDEKYVITQC